MKNFTSFIVAFSHLAFSLIISCDDGTFTFSASGETLGTPDDAKLSICTSLVGLDFLCLLRVVTLLGVLTRKGAVINLYAEAVNLPSLVQHQVCLSHPIALQKQAHLIVYIDLNLQNKYHYLSSFL